MQSSSTSLASPKNGFRRILRAPQLIHVGLSCATRMDHLIEIKASLSLVSPPPSVSIALALTQTVRVLPSAPLRILCLKLMKLFKVPRGTEGELWMRMVNGELAPLGGTGGADDDKEIDWWLENGSEVVLCTK